MGICGGQGNKRLTKLNLEQTKDQTGTTSNNENPGSSKQSKFVKQLTDFKVDPSIFVTLKKGDLLKNYKIDQVLGEGTYGKVNLVTQKATGLQRAMKIDQEGQNSN
ncbi:unnamed protein product (macronuclear) [Paramecium tetraurelia]|uniref:Protein kinase domain-containing protein n=1 Tax=Paramecium tetraurelia TaxID=5888 RepID=A0DGI9_PARTE|nr:uncharacterized protein GSPATT00002285001 [Paramecium tetraurelia]CAK82156.1 unnamed protein product [Paramecium tetraurelia]|eukprot:XP_001449553.1 hypothetical protein (macronuclear) [Paramecium tetraurelia strain d4-2]